MQDLSRMSSELTSKITDYQLTIIIGPTKQTNGRIVTIVQLLTDWLRIIQAYITLLCSKIRHQPAMYLQTLGILAHPRFLDVHPSIYPLNTTYIYRPNLPYYLILCGLKQPTPLKAGTYSCCHFQVKFYPN